MYDYYDKIKAFISTNFTPATPDTANVKLTTNSLLNFLWNAFPMGCITEYNLVEILENLGYSQTMYVVTNPDSTKKQLTLGWCFETPFDFDEVKE